MPEAYTPRTGCGAVALCCDEHLAHLTGQPSRWGCDDCGIAGAVADVMTIEPLEGAS